MPTRREEKARQRAEYVAELRRRYVEGSLDDVLVPEDANLDRLLEDIFPDRMGNDPLRQRQSR